MAPSVAACPRQAAGAAGDDARRARLVAALSSRPGPHFVTPAEFFDGNRDPGSIGCNLPDHPGIDTFRDTLVGLAARPDVEAAFLLVSEVDPGGGAWPFADTLWVAGTIPVKELRRILAPLKPDDVGYGESFHGVPAFPVEHRYRVLFAWWD